jgi:predicted Fe-Mo cluster-binding NifX family protein
MSYNIAVTSSDGKRVDLHFGHAESFYILQVDAESGGWEILEKKELHAAASCSGGDDCNAAGGGHKHENMMARIKLVVESLDGCSYLLTAKVGPKPSDLLQRSGITALESPPDIHEAVARLNKYHLKYGNINKER